MNSEVTAAGDSTVIAEMLSPLYKLLYKLQYEVLISYSRNSRSQAGNYSFRV